MKKKEDKEGPIDINNDLREMNRQPDVLDYIIPVFWDKNFTKNPHFLGVHAYEPRH
jgi:hypothetical protein